MVDALLGDWIGIGVSIRGELESGVQLCISVLIANWFQNFKLGEGD